MSKNQYQSSVTGILILICFALGCTKIDSTTIGQDLIPTVDNIHTFDTTFSVIAVNYDEPACDTVHRDNLQALGIINSDPYFGKTKAAIYVEFKPDAFPYNFPTASPDSLALDSAVLVLQYSHTFGDTLGLQRVNVYQLSDSFHVGEDYNTCRVLDYDPSVLLGQKDYYPWVLKDSVHALQEEAASQLRIPLSAEFATNLIRDSALIFRSDQDFLNYFKGFAIVPDEATGGQGLNYFDFTTTNTRLSLYVRATKAGVTDTTVIDFGLTGLCALSNSVVRDRAGSEITQHVTHPAQGDSLIYIQTSPGTYTTLTIPGLTGLSNRVINRAELILDQVPSTGMGDDIFAPPANLYLDTRDPSLNNGDYIPIPCDFSALELQTGFQHLGGQMKLTKDGAGNVITEYTFNISRYLQSIVTRGNQNLELRLRAPQYAENLNTYTDWCGMTIGAFSSVRNNVADGRVKLNGTNNTPTKMRLRVVYSVL